MFGLLVAGRLPLNNFQRISDNQFVIEVIDIDNVNQIVVYMTGEMPFPEGFAGAVYLCLMVGNEQRWLFLGKISNDKPSEIFKVSNLTHHEHGHHSGMQLFGSAMDEMSLQQQQLSRGLVGISVEPTSSIDALTPATEAQSQAQLGTLNEFTQRMLENFYNYASSFAKDAPDGRSYVPLVTLQSWFDSYKRRLDINPNFWKS